MTYTQGIIEDKDHDAAEGCGSACATNRMKKEHAREHEKVVSGKEWFQYAEERDTLPISWDTNLQRGRRRQVHSVQAHQFDGGTSSYASRL